MSRSRVATFALVLVTLVLARTPPAHADEADDEKARGDVAMDAGRAAEALEAYEKAARFRWTPALDFNRGRALLAMGDFAAALGAFESFSQKAPPELLERTSRLPEIMAELRGKVGVLTVDCKGCEHARLTVRGKPEPLGTALRQNPGPAEIVLSSAGFETKSTTIEIAPGATRTEAYSLAPIATTGALRIVGAPPRATIAVDGKPERPLPPRLELGPGPHEIVLGADGYDKRHVSIVIDRGKEREISGELAKRSPAITSRPWFWVVVGTVVAAGATAAIVASTQERPLDQGTLGTFRVP